ncbi:MAG: sugar phosphate isomerase/epimerase family protein [Candidatus Asgardarchaeia archaeon]
MHLGASIFPNFRRSLEEYFKIFSEIGLDYVEIQCRKPILFPGDDEGRVKEIRELAESFNLNLSVHSSYYDINLSSMNPSIRKASVEHTRACIRLAYGLGSNIIVVHPGKVDFIYDRNYDKVCMNLMVDSVGKLLSDLEEYGVTMGVENMEKGPSHRQFRFPGGLRDFLEKVDNEYVKVTLDVGHSNTLGIDPTKFIDTLGRKVVHIHLHDNDGSKDMHLPIGKGSIKFGGFFKKLEEVRYDGALILEVPYLEGIIESVDVMKNYYGLKF